MKLDCINLFSILLSIFLLDPSSEVYVDPTKRLDCDPEPNTTKKICEHRGCVWDPVKNKDLNVPQCYFPPGTGYIAEKENFGKNQILLQKSRQSVENPYGKDFYQLCFSFKEIGAGLHVTITPPLMNRYRPPIPIDASPDIKSSDKLEVVTKNDTIFSFSIVRQSDGEEIWNTDIGGLLFAEQFLQIATWLSTDNIYGFGENIHLSLKHNLSSYKTWAMFARDEKTEYEYGNQRNLYGTHPFYMGLSKTGKAYGLFFFNSNAQEVTLAPGPHLVYRTIGGQLEMFFFPGPTPEEVVQQYEMVIGKPVLPAYWTLGFQLCMWGYEYVRDLKAAVQRTIDNGIPIDIVYGDIDYMYRYKDFTFDSIKWRGLPKYARKLHDAGMKLILIFDPAVEPTSYDWIRAMEMNASFIEWPSYEMVDYEVQSEYPSANDTKVMLGVVWPDFHVGLPDFMDPTNYTQKWWVDEFQHFHKVIPFDGLWLDMNEPSNFGTNEEHPWYFDYEDHPNMKPLKCPVSGPGSKLEMPPYQTVNVFHWNVNPPPGQPIENFLSTKTMCMMGVWGRGKYTMYDTHNLYGLHGAMATQEALKKTTKERGIVISRSTFPSSGKYAGHWLGDNTAVWEELRTGIIGAMEFNMFGIPYVGADICGFNNATNEELCLRWHQMGAFQSYSRNHNNGKSFPPQDPGLWPSVAQAARKANLFRYQHLPYLFSLHFNTSLYGGTVVRPVFFEFPQDNITWDLSYQFMWGSAMMIVPVVYPGANSVAAYLPEESQWYSVYDHHYGQRAPPGNHTYGAGIYDLIPVFVRAGYILPRQKAEMTTTASRKNPFQLLIALANDTQSGMQYAKGELFWDDGVSIVEDFSTYNYYHFIFEFYANKNKATLIITADRRAENLFLPSLENLEIFGYEFHPDLETATLNGDQVNGLVDHPYTHFGESSLNKILNVTQTNLVDLNGEGPWELTWKNKDFEQDESLV